MVPCEKLRAHRQLVRRQPQGLTRHGFRHAVQLKQNIARPHRGDPVFGLAFALSHARFRWTRSDRFVRENTDPQLAFALHITGKSDTRGFQLRVRDPGAFECLQPELAKIDLEIARSGSLAASPLGFSILHAFWHQRHKFLLRLEPALVPELAAVEAEKRAAPLAPPSYRSNI